MLNGDAKLEFGGTIPGRDSDGRTRKKLMNGTSAIGVCCSGPVRIDVDDVDTRGVKKNEFGLLYGVEDVPPVHMSILFGLQQVLLSISSTISVPLIVCNEICAGNLELVKSEVVSTFIFMCGVCTLLQDTIGVRLPIIQGGCSKFIPAVAALMSLSKWKCPDLATFDYSGNNETMGSNSSIDMTEVWQSRMREIQGGIIVASLTQILIGCTGILGIMLRFIGPMTVVPTITLVGLSLVDVAMGYCQKHWGISSFTIFLIFLFALYLRDVEIPFPAFSISKKCHVVKYPIFKLLPVILAVILSWGLCGVLTVTDVFTSNQTHPEYMARADARMEVLSRAKWFFFPYPGQWGLPTVSVASYVAMLAATITSIIESVGDYYACARISCVRPPPEHAMNRGIAMEGFGSILSGLVGSGGATTSFSQNVGAIGFTKVASRRAFQAAGIIFILCGVIGKFGAILTMIPDPVLGGIILVSFGMVTSVGLSTLQFVDLSSGRNLCIIGSTMLIGLMVPRYVVANPGCIQTGSSELDQVLTVLLSTTMFVGGIFGFVLDNTVPGTDEERGILKWRKVYREVLQPQDKHVTYSDASQQPNDMNDTYDLPYITKWLRKQKCCTFMPFLPSFKYSDRSGLLHKCKRCFKQRKNINCVIDKNVNSIVDKDIPGDEGRFVQNTHM